MGESKTYCASDDMCNLHAVVIHHIRKVISGMPIRLEHDWIIIDTINQIQLIIRAVLTRLAID